MAGRAGAVVTCADVDGEAARFTAALVEAEGATAHVLEGDVTDAATCTGLVEAAAAAMGGLDGLVLNVGIGAGMGMQGTTPEQWDAVFAVNVRSHFLLAAAALEVMPEGGAIVFISSIAGLTPGQPHPRLRRVEGRPHRPVPAGRRRGGAEGDPGQRGGPGPDRHAPRAAGHRRPALPCQGTRPARAGRAPRGRWPSRWCSCSATRRATSPASCSPSTAGSPARGADPLPTLLGMTVVAPVPARPLGSTGLLASAQGLGCMGMSQAYGTADDDESIATIHRALDLGVTLLDTANAYGRGRNEELVGRAIAGRRRRGGDRHQDGHPHRQGSARPSRWTGRPRPSGGAATRASPGSGSTASTSTTCTGSTRRCRSRRRVGAHGGAGGGGQGRAPRACRRPGRTRCGERQPCTPSPRCRRSGRCGPATSRPRSCRPAASSGIGVVPYSPLGRGFLTGQITSPDDFEDGDMRRSLPRFQGERFQRNLDLVAQVRALADRHGATPGQVALAWLHAKGDDVFPIPGTKRRAYLEDNVGGLSIDLEPDDLAQLDAIGRGRRRRLALLPGVGRAVRAGCAPGRRSLGAPGLRPSGCRGAVLLRLAAAQPRDLAALPAGGGEVLVVLERRPVAAPRPAAGGEGVDHRVAGVDHPGVVAAAIRVARRLGREHRAALDVRVHERVDVDGPPVGVLGPAGATR